MRGKIALAAGILAAFVAGMVTVAAAAGQQQRLTGATKVHVIEHATTDAVIDTGSAGDSSGDLLTFHNRVYNQADTNVVGRDRGDCIRISPANGTWECRWTTRVAAGSLTVEGPFNDTRDSVLAITGGTGLYRNARGVMELRARAGGTKYDFIFDIVP